MRSKTRQIALILAALAMGIGGESVAGQQTPPPKAAAPQPAAGMRSVSPSGERFTIGLPSNLPDLQRTNVGAARQYLSGSSALSVLVMCAQVPGPPETASPEQIRRSTERTLLSLARTLEAQSEGRARIAFDRVVKSGPYSGGQGAVTVGESDVVVVVRSFRVEDTIYIVTVTQASEGKDEALPEAILDTFELHPPPTR